MCKKFPCTNFKQSLSINNYIPCGTKRLYPVYYRVQTYSHKREKERNAIANAIPCCHKACTIDRCISLNLIVCCDESTSFAISKIISFHSNIQAFKPLFPLYDVLKYQMVSNVITFYILLLHIEWKHIFYSTPHHHFSHKFPNAIRKLTIYMYINMYVFVYVWTKNVSKMKN